LDGVLCEDGDIVQLGGWCNG